MDNKKLIGYLSDALNALQHSLGLVRESSLYLADKVTAKSKKPDLSKQRKSIIKQWAKEKKNKTAKVFCQEHNITPATLYSWIKKYSND